MLRSSSAAEPQSAEDGKDAKEATHDQTSEKYTMGPDPHQHQPLHPVLAIRNKTISKDAHRNLAIKHAKTVIRNPVAARCT